MGKRFNILEAPGAAFVCPDADANAYFAAAGITDNTEKQAVCTLFTTLKGITITSSGNSAFDEVLYGYLCSPTQAAAVALNAFPTVAPDGVLVNSPTHSAQGLSFNGVDQYVDTGTNPSTIQSFFWQQNQPYASEGDGYVLLPFGS